MRRLPLFVTAIAVVAAAFSIYWLLQAGAPGAEPLAPYEEEPEAVEPREMAEADAPAQGGVYAGRVIDMQDRPIQGATVVLVEYEAGDAMLRNQGSSDSEDAILPELASLSFGGETHTDADGRFKIAADAQSRIQFVLAYNPPSHFLDVEKVMAPTSDLLLQLQLGGRVIGTVVDNETNRPVKGAIVDVYLQQKVGHMPDIPIEGGNVLVKREQKHKLEWLATMGRFLPKVLGPRVWGIEEKSPEALRLVTDGNGHFEIGPLGNTVQLEFVITHSRYIWYDFDTEGGTKYAKRTVVEPGETVEREFRLRTGGFVAGQVVDETGEGLPDVHVEVQCISAYYHHTFYRHKWRRTTTDDKGRFRVEGLAKGTQQIVLRHESFGTKVESAEMDTDNLIIEAEALGGLKGTIQGMTTGKAGRKITVMLELEDESSGRGRRLRESARLDTANTFSVARVEPGRYRVWILAGKESSQPVDVEIRSHEITMADFEVGGGGSVALLVFDGSGALIDPASAVLISIRNERERPMGTFVSREGELAIDGVAPGIYRLQVKAQGRIAKKTEPFEIRRGRLTRLQPLTLEGWGYVRVGQPVDAAGRPARLEGDTRIEMRQGKEPFRRVFLTTGADVAVKPGLLDVRAVSGSMRFEQQYTIEEGKVTDVTVVFDDR